MTEPQDQTSPVSVLGIIPARGGSKGIPGKNLAPLGGLPLMAHTILAGRESRLLLDLIVSTDNEEIAETARQYGASVPWLRPAELAGDAARMQDAVRHLLNHFPGSDQFDYLMLLQPTAPFRTADDIDNAIRLAAHHRPDSVVSFAHEESHHPYYMYRYEAGAPGQPGCVRPFADYEPGLPRQEFPPCVYRNGAIYLVRRTYFLEANAFVSPETVPYVMPPERSVNIDSQEDLDYAEYLWKRRHAS